MTASVSAFDLFKIGIGPSSSHTVGPMIAARQFACQLEAGGLLLRTASITVRLHGSLSATGRGHVTDVAVLLGLEGNRPEEIDPALIAPTISAIRARQQLMLLGQHAIAFTEAHHLLFERDSLAFHPNGLSFTALDANGDELLQLAYFSVGGGFVVDADGQRVVNGSQEVLSVNPALPYPFQSGRELLSLCQRHGMSMAQLMRANEAQWRSPAEVDRKLQAIWRTMQDIIERGCRAEGVLPGRMQLKRRAAGLFQRLTDASASKAPDPLAGMDWVNLYALAVNEENAAGGRVVTAPTNGAAGVLPAVLQYYRRFTPSSSELGVAEFLLTAAAIGIIYKHTGSLSGAEVGCQGEVGVACSMAAAGLAAVMGGSPQQVENAAEIGMEHNLGLSCDPVAGQVQIPCIERNAMGAIKAINAARMALSGNGEHVVSLDQVIQTMMQTGADMKSKYKETSLGGLAVNIVEC